MIINFSCRTEIGLVRKNNEDNFYCEGTILTGQEIFSLRGFAENPCIFAVSDGMGGESHGELASLITVETLHEHAGKIKSATNNDIDKSVQNFISDSNTKICTIMRENSFRMGSTLALVVIHDDYIRAYNIGDSRIYKLQNGILSRISEDHTLAEQKIKMGLLTPEDSRHDKSRHVLTRCMGIFDEEMILMPNIIKPIRINKNFKLLICSDGLNDMLYDSEIQDIILLNKDTFSAVNALIEAALQRGGRDNITCIIIDINNI